MTLLAGVFCGGSFQAEKRTLPELDTQAKQLRRESLTKYPKICNNSGILLGLSILIPKHPTPEQRGSGARVLPEHPLKRDCELGTTKGWTQPVKSAPRAGRPENRHVNLNFNLSASPLKLLVFVDTPRHKYLTKYQSEDYVPDQNLNWYEELQLDSFSTK
eukprot:scaffold64287_cov41-Cyclotella_meneghiniana.AAC.1